MFYCFLCRHSFLSVPDVAKHLRKWHALYDSPTLRLQCFNQNCLQYYETFSGYRKHIQKCATSININNVPLACNSDDVAYQNTSSPMQLKPLLHFNQQLVPNSSSTLTINSYCAEYVSKLYSMGVPDSTIQTVIESTQELLQICLKSNNLDYDNVKDVFSNFNSKHKRQQYFKDHIVEPVQVPIGTRYDQIWDKNVHAYKQVPVPRFCTYIPILKTLQFILQNQSYRKLLQLEDTTIITTTDNNILSEFTHGSLHKTSEFLQQKGIVFKLQLYFDEFESVNPLGSKTGGHKIGAVYMIIRNIPSHFNSTLNNIYLVSLFYSSDIKTVGLNSVLEVIVKDINILETEGVYDEISEKYIKGTLVALSHDNLGANQLFGMVESFSANYYCRICLTDKTTAQKLSSQNDTLLRNNDLYEEHCNSLSSVPSGDNVFGIKFRSSLNNLRYFKLCNNPSVDIMHDLLEGVVQLELKLFLKFVIQIKKTITLDEVNERLKSFNFGINNNFNKPSPICLDKPGHSIGQRAAQSLCLIKLIPLILSDIISSLTERDKRKYKVIQMLIQIIDVVFCPVNSIGMVSQLTDIITEHHNLFKHEYDCNLTPKHHMMTHYRYIILKMRPLIGLSCMRFEGKHGYFKNLVHNLKNYKSVCHTLAFRHQEHIWHQWNNIDISLNPVYGKCRNVNLFNTDFGKTLYATFNIPSHTELVVTKSIQVSSVVFQKKMFVTEKRCGLHFPVFSGIIELCIFEDNSYLICKEWITRLYHELYLAYVIDVSDNFTVINVKNLKHFVSYELHCPYHENITLIVPKYEIIT